MNKIASKLTEMSAKYAAAGITLNMLRGSALRSVGGMLRGAVTGNKDLARTSAKRIGSSLNLFGRELAGTKGAANPKAMKNLLKSTNTMTTMSGLSNRVGAGDLAGVYKGMAKRYGNAYSSIKRGVNPYSHFAKGIM